jgi:biopolymer transport protein ExbD
VAVKLSHGKALSMLSLTSLIDVVFLLLIFFLVATKFAEEDRLRQMPVDLPSASEARPLTQRPEELQITVSATGGFYIGPQAMSLAELDRYLQAVAANNPLNQTAIIQADRRAAWEAVASALNACQAHGIRPTPRMKDFTGTTQ